MSYTRFHMKSWNQFSYEPFMNMVKMSNQPYQSDTFKTHLQKNMWLQNYLKKYDGFSVDVQLGFCKGVEVIFSSIKE